jgi:hypothetical protein
MRELSGSDLFSTRSEPFVLLGAENVLALSSHPVSPARRPEAAHA